MRILLLVVTSWAITALPIAAQPRGAKLLTERIKQTSKPDASHGTWTPAFVLFPEVFFNREELAIADELRRLGPEAIPHLLPLLRDENAAARDLAYYTLADIEGWTEEHLDALIGSYRGGDDWIPLAIAKIGTPRAANFLVEQTCPQAREMGPAGGGGAESR